MLSRVGSGCTYVYDDDESWVALDEEFLYTYNNSNVSYLQFFDAATATVDYYDFGAGNDVGSLTRVGDDMFMVAGTDELGGELWLTDGTVGGIRMIKDINFGAEGSGPEQMIPSERTWPSSLTTACTSLSCGSRVGPRPRRTWSPTPSRGQGTPSSPPAAARPSW